MKILFIDDRAENTKCMQLPQMFTLGDIYTIICAYPLRSRCANDGQEVKITKGSWDPYNINHYYYSFR